MKKNWKEIIKERVRLSNEAVKNGLPADPWVIEHRKKNNAIKAAWKLRLPEKPKVIRTENAGMFKKGIKPHNLLVSELEINTSLQNKKIRESNWRKNNREKTNEQLRLKRKTDPQFKVKSNLRKRLSFLIRLHNAKKSKQTLDLLGCSMEFFMGYIEGKFSGEMNWSNYGIKGWHIDHVTPCYYFDLSDPAAQQQCFHYTNLQPLWWSDNLKKNKRLNYMVAI